MQFIFVSYFCFIFISNLKHIAEMYIHFRAFYLGFAPIGKNRKINKFLFHFCSYRCIIVNVEVEIFYSDVFLLKIVN